MIYFPNYKSFDDESAVVVAVAVAVTVTVTVTVANR